MYNKWNYTNDIVIQKGMNREVDSYSGFGSEDCVREITPLDQHLKELDIKYVIIGGLAFDYCVSATAKDAARLGKRSNTIFVIGLQKFINFILSFI